MSKMELVWHTETFAKADRDFKAAAGRNKNGIELMYLQLLHKGHPSYLLGGVANGPPLKVSKAGPETGFMATAGRRSFYRDAECEAFLVTLSLTDIERVAGAISEETVREMSGKLYELVRKTFVNADGDARNLLQGRADMFVSVIADCIAARNKAAD
ncbi:MAG: hypothetical protein Q7T86_11805 [Hyphomicrobiaceae bacterium]|nr:hypothetical protein [Hyphomicrobiaceae bacterium]